MTKTRFLLLAGFADSIPEFRGALIRSIFAAENEVHIAAPGIESSLVSRAFEDVDASFHDVAVRRAGMNPLGDLALLVSLTALLFRIRPTTILSYTVKPVIYGTVAAWIAGVPNRFALVTGLGYAYTGGRGGPLRLVVTMLYRFALGRAHKVFFQNPDDERLFRELGILAPGIPSVIVSGSGVDLLRFSSIPLPLGPPVFLMIGRLLGDKGVREFAEAARNIRLIHPNVRCQLVGWIDENPDAIAQAELDEWVASGTVEFLGKLADVRPAIAACTVYVLPSYREGTPRTVLEAMAMGRPVITTDAPGCRETVVDGINGFLVELKSVEALVATMLRFIDDPGLAPRMGMRSRQIAEDKYDVHKVNAVMLREMGITAAGTRGEEQA